MPRVRKYVSTEVPPIGFDMANNRLAASAEPDRVGLPGRFFGAGIGLYRIYPLLSVSLDVARCVGLSWRRSAGLNLG